MVTIEQRNQCDGCCSGWPLENGIHRDPSGQYWNNIACTADRYGHEPLTSNQEVEAWLIECWTPGKRMAYATVQKDDNNWWPVDQWKGVTRTPLGKIGASELIHGAPSPGSIARPADETTETHEHSFTTWWNDGNGNEWRYCTCGARQRRGVNGEGSR